MSNHGNVFDEEISKKMQDIFRERSDVPHSNALKEELFRKSAMGSTGNFPEGKLIPSDEGEIIFGIGAKDGKVVLEFATPVVWFGMQPEQAVSLAESLLEKAAKLGYIRPVKITIGSK